GVTFCSYGEQDNGNVPGAGAVPPGPPAAPGFTNPSAASIQAQQGEDRPTYPQVQANTDPASPGNAQIGCVGPRAGDPAVNAATCTHDAGTQGEDRPGETTNGVTGGQRRFDIFKSQFLAQERAGTVPAFNYMLLMNDHTNGTTPGTYTPKALVADNDLALGQMLDVISHSSVWKDSAIFVVEDDSQDGADHVDAHRMPSFVISPYTRPGGTVIPTRYDHYSAIRTMELILGLRPLSLNDGLATPIYDAFTSGVPDLTPYSAVQPEQNLNETNKPNAPMNRLSAALPFSEVDLVPQSLSDRILWRSVYGADAQTPTPGPDASLAEQERAAGALDVYRRDGDVTGWLESHSTDGEAKGKTDAGPDPAG
ncbi:MAG: alkaline phosphatase family protein, partial [Acidimicrobiales bacterium]